MEYRPLGRTGVKVSELGVCPAAEMEAADGYCEGVNGGRACMYITGTYCGGHIQGTHRDKSKQCAVCDFYKLLMKEDLSNIIVSNFNLYVKEKL